MPVDRQRLDLVIDRIVPADADPGALDLGTPAYVLARLDADPALAELISDGLATLPAGFGALSPDARDMLLRSIEAQPWFAALVELTGEGFWADPGNGGNRDARSWTIVGYRHGLPEGPSGPPGRPR
jgi:hypothetical protein